jgi:hypothetical protein
MACEIEFTDEFGAWWETLSDQEQRSVATSVGLLREFGIALGYPHSSGIQQSKHSAMRELRIQHEGRPYRVLYIFDPRRMAVLLLGGEKTGQDRWYEIHVPLADAIYDRLLLELTKEGKI